MHGRNYQTTGRSCRVREYQRPAGRGTFSKPWLPNAARNAEYVRHHPIDALLLTNSAEVYDDRVEPGCIFWHGRKEDQSATISLIHAVFEQGSQILLLASFIYWYAHEPDDENLSLSAGRITNEAVPSDDLHILPQGQVNSVLRNLPGLPFGTYVEEKECRKRKGQSNRFKWRNRCICGSNFVFMDRAKRLDNERGQTKKKVQRTRHRPHVSEISDSRKHGCFQTHPMCDNRSWEVKPRFEQGIDDQNPAPSLTGKRRLDLNPEVATGYEVLPVKAQKVSGPNRIKSPRQKPCSSIETEP